MAAIPIGAYQPNWFMKHQHVHPGEAVQIHKDIKSGRSLGIHWGTFMLTTEYYLEPPVLLTSFMNRLKKSTNTFINPPSKRFPIYGVLLVVAISAITRICVLSLVGIKICRDSIQIL